MTKITLEIEGMRCMKCEAHMNEAVKSAYKVKKVTSSHTDNKTIIITSEDISEESLGKIVSDAGYKLKGVKKEPYAKKIILGKLFG